MMLQSTLPTCKDEVKAIKLALIEKKLENFETPQTSCS
jgi:hypothetical protein